MFRACVMCRKKAKLYCDMAPKALCLLAPSHIRHYLMRKPPKTRPCMLRCCGWQVKVFCSFVLCMSTASPCASAGRSSMALASASCASAHSACRLPCSAHPFHHRQQYNPHPWMPTCLQGRVLRL